ncbi:MAG: sigma-70 family RNA polymerase sigma factor [Candidatus Krumholzibacteria bacterium]|nr:sigma-70 family RNA polymerase sigma factor [Candidatus Krumholzibacteria bacterium]
MVDEDKVLIERCLRGDEKAFEELLSKYRRSVFSICLRMVRNRSTAEDIAQEVFVKVFSALGRYDPTYPFSSWLNRITSNLCIDHLRREKERTVSLDQPVEGADNDLLIQIPAAGAGPDREMESKEIMAILEEALATIPEHYRIIVILRHQEQLSYEEISDTLGIPLGTVKARIHRARNMIVEHFRRRGLFRDSRAAGGDRK